MRRSFADRGFVQIGPFLAGDTAIALRDHLQSRADWSLSVLAGGKTPIEIGRSTWDAMTAAQRKALHLAAAPQDPDSFRYMFEQIVSAGDDRQNREPETPLGRLTDFMSSQTVIELARYITGAPDISGADARASRYGPGHFLTAHDDRSENLQRRAAYVLGLTEQWRVEWGGLLLFHSREGDILHGKVPRMNVLTLFSVPQVHSVSLVSPFAPHARYSVTGWFRAAASKAPGPNQMSSSA